MKTMLRVGSVLILVALLAPAAWAKSPVNTTLFGKKAVKGYDVVAYFTDGKAVEGSDAFEVEWNGAKWRFASAEHRDLFQADPSKYAPQYGGYCAYGVARGSLVDIDPQSFAIVDGRLYLNYSPEIQEKWKEDVPGYITKADENWPGLIQ